MSIGLMVVAIMTFLNSCVSVKEIGRLNVVSVRNIDPNAKYVMVQKNVEYSRREFHKIRTESLEDAVDAVVKKAAGGEYLMNAKISLIIHDGLFGYTTYYAVEGDVYGIQPGSIK